MRRIPSFNELVLVSGCNAQNGKGVVQFPLDLLITSLEQGVAKGSEYPAPPAGLILQGASGPATSFTSNHLISNMLGSVGRLRVIVDHEPLGQVFESCATNGKFCRGEEAAVARRARELAALLCASRLKVAPTLSDDSAL